MDPVKRTGDGDRGSRAVLTGVVISYWTRGTERGRLLQKRRGDEQDTEAQRGGTPAPERRKDQQGPDDKSQGNELGFFFFFTGVINYPKTKGRLEVGDG
jgi:hypothetical protein